MPLSTHVSTASGQQMPLAEGSRLIFGRGPEVDLIVAAGPGLVPAGRRGDRMAAGAWIANISRTHALYVEGDGYQVRLPRMEDDGEPASGWFVRTGTALVGSRAMLDEGQSLVVTVTPQAEEAAVPRRARRTDEAGWLEPGWLEPGWLARLSGPPQLMSAGPVRPSLRRLNWPVLGRCCRSTWTR